MLLTVEGAKQRNVSTKLFFFCENEGRFFKILVNAYLKQPLAPVNLILSTNNIEPLSLSKGIRYLIIIYRTNTSGSCRAAS